MLTRCGWAAEHVLFVGDAMSDLRAAISSGLSFIGRVPRGETSPFPPGTRTIVDLSELPAGLCIDAAPGSRIDLVRSSGGYLGAGGGVIFVLAS